MPLDELVEFINEGSSQKKKKRRKKGAKTEPVDEEVERFRARLSQESLSSNRLKPCISDLYIDSLRRRIMSRG